MDGCVLTWIDGGILLINAQRYYSAMWGRTSEFRCRKVFYYSYVYIV